MLRIEGMRVLQIEGRRRAGLGGQAVFFVGVFKSHSLRFGGKLGHISAKVVKIRQKAPRTSTEYPLKGPLVDLWPLGFVLLDVQPEVEIRWRAKKEQLVTVSRTFT